MGKKKEEGAPAYMALMASLWIVMLAFFILLNSMASVQEAGFKAGIGKIKNAFGSRGGLGILTNLFSGKGGAESVGDKESGEIGVDAASVKGSGGGNITDARFESSKIGEYVRIRVPFTFEPGSASLSMEFKEYLTRVGSGLVVFECAVDIKNYSGDSENYAKNVKLAVERANAIKDFLKTSFRYPEDKIDAAGYPDPRYMATTEAEKKNLLKLKQASFFYMFLRR